MNSVLNAAKKGRLKVLLRRSFSLNSRDHAFAILGLKSFSDSEIKQSFRKLQEITKGSTLELANKDNKLEPLAPSVNVQEGIQRLAEAEYAVKLDQKTINKVSRAVLGASPTPASTDDAQGNVQNGGSPVLLTLPEYRKKVLDLGEKLDPRVWNIGLSFLCTGEQPCVVQYICVFPLVCDVSCIRCADNYCDNTKTPSKARVWVSSSPACRCWSHSCISLPTSSAWSCLPSGSRSCSATSLQDTSWRSTAVSPA